MASRFAPGTLANPLHPRLAVRRRSGRTRAANRSNIELHRRRGQCRNHAIDQEVKRVLFGPNRERRIGREVEAFSGGKRRTIVNERTTI